MGLLAVTSPFRIKVTSRGCASACVEELGVWDKVNKDCPIDDFGDTRLKIQYRRCNR